MGNSYRALDNRVMDSEKYVAGRELLGYILKKQSPPDSLISFVHNTSHASILSDLYEQFYSNQSFVLGEIRLHNPNASQEIAFARRSLDDDKRYLRLHSFITRGIIPDISYFEPFYGEYSADVAKLFSIFNSVGLFRTGNVPTVSHLNRTGCTAYKLIADNGTKNLAALLMAYHDSIEDIFTKMRDSSEKVYSMQRHQEFVNDFIPKIIQNGIINLTNYYHMILKSVSKDLLRQDKAETFDNFFNAIRLKYMAIPNDPVLTPKLETLLTVLSRDNIVNKISSNYVFSSLKRIVYPIYQEEMLKYCIRQNNFLVADGKCIDLSDNGHGKSDMNLRERIKNTVKRSDFVHYGDVILGSGQDKNWIFDQKLRELEEDSLLDAENIIIDKLINSESRIDHILSALNSLIYLLPVFYKGKSSTEY